MAVGASRCFLVADGCQHAYENIASARSCRRVSGQRQAGDENHVFDCAAAARPGAHRATDWLSCGVTTDGLRRGSAQTSCDIENFFSNCLRLAKKWSERRRTVADRPLGHVGRVYKNDLLAG